VIVGLAKAIQAALAYQREMDQAPVLASADEDAIEDERRTTEDERRKREDW
jgi:hypothetical protein